MTNDTGLQKRLSILSVVLIGISLILLGRMLSFQFYMDPQTKSILENESESRTTQTYDVLPNRGEIYDRNGYLLAVNSVEYKIGISPNQVTNDEEVARELAPLVGMSEIELYNVLQPNADGIYTPWVLLASQVGFDAGQKIAELDISGVTLDPIPTRIYPQGALTGQIVGMYRGSDDSLTGRGYWGVEGFYNTLLAGQSKRVTTSVIPNLEEADIEATEVRDGIDLMLTIDRDVQNLAEEVLTKAVNEDPTTTGGTILIMNPRTGEILAMANVTRGMEPFDPTNMSADNMKMAKNPAISDIYEPGSVFKLVTMAIALEAGTHDLNWTYQDPGNWNIAGITISNWDRISHGNPMFADVFINSWNTGTATIFYEMGPYTVYPLLEAFGIGSRTGVDLEGEEAGLLTDMSNPNWNEAQFLTTSFGQGVSVTPLQMLCFVNAIANDGIIMQPHIVKARSDGDKGYEMQPAAARRPISAQTAHTARDIMVQVIENPKSEDLFELPGYTVAGKTGTAEIPTATGYDLEHSIASFVGFLPADDPVVSIIVKLDRPSGYWGSKTAAPVFQELVERLVVIMEIMPDNTRYELVARGGDPLNREY